MENIEKSTQPEENRKLCTITFYILVIDLILFPIAYILENYYTFPNNTIPMSISMTLLLVWMNMNSMCFSNKKENIISILMIFIISPILFFLIPYSLFNKQSVYDKIILMMMYSTVISWILLWLYSKMRKIVGKLNH